VIGLSDDLTGCRGVCHVEAENRFVCFVLFLVKIDEGGSFFFV
jgi:hypothetical protein